MALGMSKESEKRRAQRRAAKAQGRNALVNRMTEFLAVRSRELVDAGIVTREQITERALKIMSYVHAAADEYPEEFIRENADRMLRGGEPQFPRTYDPAHLPPRRGRGGVPLLRSRQRGRFLSTPEPVFEPTASRILRVSLYDSPYRGGNPNDPANPANRPQTGIHLVQPGASIDTSALVAEGVSQGLFVVLDEFDAPFPMDKDEAYDFALTRQHIYAQREVYASMLFHWDAQALLSVSPGGTVAGNRPTPCSREEVQEVLRQLALHPAYAGHTVIAIAKDGMRFVMRDGSITS